MTRTIRSPMFCFVFDTDWTIISIRQNGNVQYHHAKISTSNCRALLTLPPEYALPATSVDPI